MAKTGQLYQWKVAHAGLIIISTVIALLVVERAVIVPAAGAISLGFIWTRQNRLRSADVVTAFRALAAGFAFVLMAFGVGGYLFPLLLMVLAEMSDFLDGYLARRAKSTAFGATWDLEIDAFFIMLLSLSAKLYVGIGAWVLICGFLRYVFVFTYLFVRPVAIKNWTLNLFMKTACVIAAISLIVANQGWLNSELRVVGAALAVVFLVISFFWELGYYLFAPAGSK